MSWCVGMLFQEIDLNHIVKGGLMGICDVRRIRVLRMGWVVKLRGVGGEGSGHRRRGIRWHGSRSRG